MSLEVMVQNLINALIGAIAWSASGYLKNASKNKEKFSWYKFLRSLIIGIFVGLFSGYLNLPYDQTVILIINTGIIAIIDNLTKAIWHKVKPYLVEAGLEPESFIAKVLD